jgi:chromosome segregation ATPase
MQVREFAAALTAALDILDQVAGAEDRAAGAERQVAAAESKLAAHAEAHAKLKADSDAHLQDNLARLNEETAAHQSAVDRLRKQHSQLELRGKEQLENASAMLTSLNSQVGEMRKERDALSIEINKMKATVTDLAARI